MGVRFHLFRYQILPKNRYMQLSLMSEIRTIEQLLEKKNELFFDALLKINNFKDSRHDTITKRLYKDNDFILFKIAINRAIRRETKDFTEEYIDHWPSVLVAIWNNPDIQLFAIQKRTTAFKHTETVVSLILNSVNSLLARHNLTVFCEPLFEEKVFWDIINEHKDKIQRIEFEFLTPNMANISGELSESLKEFAMITNSVKNELNIESDAQSSLHIDHSNQTICSLVNYSSKGGGNIAVKIHGIKKKFHTHKTVKEIEIDDLHLEGPAEEVSNILKEVMT